MLKEKKTQTAFAEAIGVNKSTVSRELNRNSTGGKYHYTTAQEMCEINPNRSLGLISSDKNVVF